MAPDEEHAVSSWHFWLAASLVLPCQSQRREATQVDFAEVTVHVLASALPTRLQLAKRRLQVLDQRAAAAGTGPTTANGITAAAADVRDGIAP